MIAPPPSPGQPLRPLRPRFVKAVVVVVLLFIGPRIATPLLSIGAVKGTVTLTRDDPLRVEPSPSLLESLLGDVGRLKNGDTVYVRCRTTDGQYGSYTLVRRPPLFRSRRTDSLKLDAAVQPC